jgi:hypothetical protein
MRNGFCFLLLASCLSAQQLTVRSASASRVELAWTGASPEWLVERQAGSGQFEMIAAVSGDAYADGKIGAYATYHYRVLSQAGPVSNLVIVGPPPAGVSVSARLPAKVDPENMAPKPPYATTKTATRLSRLSGPMSMATTTTATTVFTSSIGIALAIPGWRPSKPVCQRRMSILCDWRAIGRPAPSRCHVAEKQGVQVALSHDGGATGQTAALAADLEGMVSSTGMVRRMDAGCSP